MTIFRVSFTCRADQERLHRAIQRMAHIEGLVLNDDFMD